jgi:type II secretory pathway pseudopilin PulG
MKGFTLIEIIIYVALLSLTIGFILVGIYQIFDSKAGALARTSVEEEANFLIKKIKWALINVDIINQPAAGATSTTLSVNKFNFSANPVAISRVDSDLNISYAANPATILNSEDVSIKDLVFENISGGNNPAIKVKLSLEYRPGDLKTTKPSTTIETTIYLRKQ